MWPHQNSLISPEAYLRLSQATLAWNSRAAGLMKDTLSFVRALGSINYEMWDKYMSLLPSLLAL